MAARFLRRRGHRIVARNFGCALGEIDIITLDDDTVVFVEVKTRASDEHAELVDAVNATKWHRVERAARYYLKRSSAEDCPCRFDFVTVLWRPHRKPQIEHLENAYQPS